MFSSTSASSGTSTSTSRTACASTSTSSSKVAGNTCFVCFVNSSQFRQFRLTICVFIVFYNLFYNMLQLHVSVHNHNILCPSFWEEFSTILRLFTVQLYGPVPCVDTRTVIVCLVPKLWNTSYIWIFVLFLSQIWNIIVVSALLCFFRNIIPGDLGLGPPWPQSTQEFPKFLYLPQFITENVSYIKYLILGIIRYKNKTSVFDLNVRWPTLRDEKVNDL